jgi:hypothetical protein
MHLFQLDISELVGEGLFVIARPGVVVFVVFEQLLELVVVDVLVFPRRVDALAQSGAELHGRTSPKDPAADISTSAGSTSNCSPVGW